MGEVIMLRPQGKRVREKPIPLEDDRLVLAVEAKLAEEQLRGEWRLNKRRPRERHDLIVLARNLAVMRNQLPHGKKSQALLSAAFRGADDANAATYANNLLLPLATGTPSPDRLRRLSPKVRRYIDVAVVIEGDRKRAISRLFRRTSLDRDFSDDWQGKLSARLDRLAAEVDAATGLARYFDDASAANVCLADGNGFSFRATGWLSETFHKDEFSEARSEHPEGAWLYDRHEEGVPRGGGPLFVPMVPLDIRSRNWRVRRSNGEGPDLSCMFTLELHAAIVPVAATLDEPCQVECWLIERPRVRVQSVNEAVWQVLVGASNVSIRVGDETFHPVDEAGFRAWSLTEEGRLVVEKPEPGYQSDLLNGGWWCIPASAAAIARRLSKPRAGGHPLKATYAQNLRSIVEHIDDLGETDFHAVASDLYPPQDTLALDLTYGLIDLEKKLRAEAERLIWTFQEFRQRVRSASPLSE